MRDKENGFTLIELLVVLVIIGSLTYITIFSFSSSINRELEIEAKRLYTILKIASDEAIFQNIELGLNVQQDLYYFLEYDEENQTWITPNNKQLGSRNLPETITLQLQLEGKELNLGQDLSTPSILLLSSGEITPFILTFWTPDTHQPLYIISTDGFSDITLQSPQQ